MKQKTPGGSSTEPPGVSSWVNALEKGLGPGVLPQPTEVRVLLQLAQQQGPQLSGLEFLGLGGHTAVQYRVPQLPGLLQDSPSHLGWWEVGGPAFDIDAFLILTSM